MYSATSRSPHGSILPREEGLAFRVQCFVSGIWCSVFRVEGLVFGVPCLAEGLVFGVWCFGFSFWFLAFDVWCLAFGVSGSEFELMEVQMYSATSRSPHGSILQEFDLHLWMCSLHLWMCSLHLWKGERRLWIYDLL